MKTQKKEMRVSKWKAVWEKKGMESFDFSGEEFEVFCALKKANGFDVSVRDENAYYTAFYEEWKEMYKKGRELLQGKGEDQIGSVYEVGCGSGVNLYLFQNRIKGLRTGGIDYSQSLIDIAGKVVDSVDLICGEAAGLDETQKYDWVMAESVFQYFTDTVYAEDVLEKMIHKAEKIVYVAELHDEALREDWLAYRRGSMEDYDRRYEGLDKTFYSREWVMDIAERNHKKVLFTKSDNPEYWNSRYIFNCFIY